jgi:hypothetical protein
MVPIHNKSPFAAELFSLADLDGQEVLLLVVAATFGVDDAYRLRAVDPQPPIHVADEHYGDPANSSVRFEGDVALEKPYVDVIVNGTAYAPAGRPVGALPVELHVGDIHKRLIVYGDRKRRLGGSASDPEPFVTMPIVYERAYGGYDRRDTDPAKHKIYFQNPVGLAFRNCRSSDPAVTSEFPNIEYQSGPVMPGTGIPAGFGIVGRAWTPRLQLAGTFDAEWLRNQWPLLPKNFQSRHYQAAPIDQQSPQIGGGAEVVLTNLTPRGDWRIRLPVLDIPVRLYFSDRVEHAVPRADTVLLQPDQKMLTLSSRLRIPVRRNRRALKEIVLGHVSSAWRRAYELGKRYVDTGGTAGVDRSRVAWS